MLVLDLETKKQFSDVGGQNFAERLGVSLVGIYDYEKDTFRAFREEQIGELLELIRARNKVIGFNIKAFDWKVLQPYSEALSFRTVPTIDLMEDVANFLGFRVGLASLAETNLGESKSGHGLEAIRWYEEGNWEKLEKYCLDDVRLTRDLYEFGRKNRYVKVTNRNGSTTVVPVRWGAHEEKDIVDVLRRGQLARVPVSIEYIAAKSENDSFRQSLLVDVLSVLARKIEVRDYNTGKAQELQLACVVDAKIAEVPRTHSLF